MKEEDDKHEVLQHDTITSASVVMQNTNQKAQTTLSLSQIPSKNPSSLYTNNNSQKRLKDSKRFYPSSTTYFNNNLNKCYENLTNLKEKMKTINHSSTQKSLNNQMFSSQIQKVKDDYTKLKKNQLDLQMDQTFHQEPSQYLTEENESWHVSNQILNKTNVDLKNQLKSMENQFQYNKSIQDQMKDMVGYIDHLKIELANENRNKNEFLLSIDSFKNEIDLLSKDNQILHNQLEETNNAYSHLVNEQKKYEIIVNRLQSEKELIMSNNQISQGKDYYNLQNKLTLSEEMIQSLKKTKIDYEELIANMKKTITILTDSNMNQDVIQMQSIIQEKDFIIQKNNNLIKQLQKEQNLYEQQENQSIYQSNKINNKQYSADNDIIDLNNKLKHEIDILSNTTKQLYQIINDKDSLIEQLKNNYSFLNNSLITIQKKQENVLSELKALNIYPNRNLNNSSQMCYSDSKELLLTNLKKNAEEIKYMLINATNNSNKTYNRNDNMNKADLQITQENYNEQKSNELSMNYNQLTYENEQLKTENRLLRSECEVANKKFSQILYDQSPIYLQTTTSHQSANIMTKNMNRESSDIMRNNICLYRIYDSRRIIRFDLSQKDYQIVEFIDYDSFDSNYKSIGSVLLNTLDGLFILTGAQNDVLFYYNNEKVTMSKVTKLSHNHSHGGLILDEINSSIIALSGWHNKKVEKYTNTKLILSQYTSTKDKSVEMMDMPDMTIERSESGYLYYNNDAIFAFFGYCYPSSEYIDTVEHLLLNPGAKQAQMEWQTLNFQLKSSNTNTLIKAHGIAMINEDEVLILGGFNGLKNISVENLLRFDIKMQLFEEINRKLPNIGINHCYNFDKESQFVTYEDENNNIFIANIDEMDNVHIIETSSLNYDLFKFD